MRQRLFLVVVAVSMIAGCGSGEEGAPPTVAAVELESEDASVLKRPFTAEQIRDEWIEGFTLTMRRSTPEGETTERWTVLEADEEGATIEFLTLEGPDDTTGQSATSRTTWVGLRDHATYSPDNATREEAVRDTPLGTLEGWLYTVREDSEGTVTEYFFARDLPGAPVSVHTMRGDELVLKMTQLERLKPPVRVAQ